MEGKQGLTKSEFLYLLNHHTSEFPLDFECQNCLQKARVELASFFDFVDCSGDQEITPQELIHSFKNMDLTGIDVKCENVNEFFRQADRSRNVKYF